jgi:tRNA G18 (ribose-2'-O)-methylase SpoU
MSEPTVSASAEPASEAGGLEFLLFGLQSPINIGMVLRVAETYQCRVSIYDPHAVLDDPTKFRTITDFACGAVARWGFRIVRDTADLDRIVSGRRLIATSIEPKASALPDFRFRRGDLFALGNEYDGLSDDLLARAAEIVTIPMPNVWTPKPKSQNPIDPTRTAAVARDGQANLNVAMSAGIICYAAFVDRMRAPGMR